MSRAPLVSIVVPAFNHGRFVAEAIRSVLAQDYPHIELIVLDDGSTDDTAQVLAQFPAERFHRETHANCGQSATLNKGWRMSRGEILSYLSADDVLRPDAVSRSVACLDAHSSAVVSYCDFDLISPESTVVRHVRAPDYCYRSMLVRTVCQPGPGVFFRRAAFERAGPWNASYRQMPDFEFWLRMGLAGDFRRIPETLAGFRVHPGSQTFAAAAPAKCEEPIRIMAEFFRRSDLPPHIRRDEAEAVSNAHLIAAHLHWRSGRYAQGVRTAARALRMRLRSIVAPYTGRLVLSAMFSRLRHAILARLPATA